MLLTACSSSEGTQPTPPATSVQQTVPPSATTGAEELLAGIKVSNLVDRESQKLARTALVDAGIPAESINRFFDLVGEYYSAVPTDSLITSGFKDYGTSDPDYDVEGISTTWKKHHANYAGTNCRINTFTLTDSLYTVADESNPSTDLLFLDKESLNNATKPILDSAERAKFEAFYSNIRTTSVPDPAKHIADIKSHFKNRGIRFADSQAHVISMFSHDTLTDPATLFVGHTGLAVPYKGGFLFLEKLAFDMPYQAITVKDMRQLNDYLMNKYDDGPGLEYGRPVIFDNDEVIEGLRYAKKP